MASYILYLIWKIYVRKKLGLFTDQNLHLQYEDTIPKRKAVIVTYHVNQHCKLSWTLRPRPQEYQDFLKPGISEEQILTIIQQKLLDQYECLTKEVGIPTSFCSAARIAFLFLQFSSDSTMSTLQSNIH